MQRGLQLKPLSVSDKKSGVVTFEVAAPFYFLAMLNDLSAPVEIPNEIKWNLLALRRAERNIASAFTAFRDNGIEPILIKGWAAARFYPDDRPRSFGDMDVAVAVSEFEIAKSLILEPTFPRVGIDLHREFRHLDTVDWNILFERSELVEIDDVPVRVLSPEDHLRILAVHWLNDGAAYRERLWDIYYAVENRPPDFDWEICLNSVSRTRRRWVAAAIFAAHKYLGLEIHDVPLEPGERRLPKWFVRTIEREWSSDVRLRPLQTCVRQPRVFVQQIRKRFPPNAIQATIETEGEFDDTPRVFYQAKDVLRRVPASLARISRTILRRSG